MGRFMGPQFTDPAAPHSAEQLLAAELARGDRAARAVVPVLRHLLASEGPSLVSEAVVARVRGMLHDLACQIYSGKRQAVPATAVAEQAIDIITERLVAHESLLAHIHNLALESQLAERFEQTLSLDPVLSPLLQELIASDDPAVAELAMSTLAAQARFMQSQRRMELPLEELPAELLNKVIWSGDGLLPPEGLQGLAVLQTRYDEAATRLALLGRLVAAMRRAVVACLAFDRAGLALFASGVAAMVGSLRADVIVSCNEQQTLRLALALRAAGLEIDGIERLILLVGAASPAFRELANISPQQALERFIASGPVRQVPG
jgi:hypothetical protein